ncbi:hypothetical protein AB0I34_17530 [Kribbella sp. NPDC050281]|uniref:hypothetical protein n=1 Tax=Kribbella sp. NPDC050281 TaxID=3155515 RepID=UPI0033F912A3
MPASGEIPVADSAPQEVKDRSKKEARTPQFDATVGVPAIKVPKRSGTPKHRLVAIGDSLTHGFQSGAVFNTDISYPAIIAYELGWLDKFRYPRYSGYGGLPLNMELLLRELADRFGAELNLFEVPLALFAARSWMGKLEDYYERGDGSHVPVTTGYNHALAVYGWDLRDALEKTYDTCAARIGSPRDDLIHQIVQNHNDRAALSVYPNGSDDDRKLTLFQAAAKLGDEKEDAECGIETLIVFLGANNALKCVTQLRVGWSGDDYRELGKKEQYTVWQPTHFGAEFAEIVDEIKKINARHVILCTVPHVTIPPISRGIGTKIQPGSRYFPHYTRPWIRDEDFDPRQDKSITGPEAFAVDVAIDMFNQTIEDAVRAARKGNPARDWYLLDAAGLLDRMASRRFITDPNARPDWWTPYPLPPALKALQPVVDSRYLASDGRGGRAAGGLFSLDGVHPTTVAYGILAQETINILRIAGVPFTTPNGTPRPDPVNVDFDRLIRLDTLVQRPPENVTPTLDILSWADEKLDWAKRALTFLS